MQEYSVEITLNHPDDVLALFGSNERHLKLIEDNLGVIIHARTERVQILGDDEESVELARVTIQALLVLVSRGMLVNTSDVVTALSMAQNVQLINLLHFTKKRSLKIILESLSVLKLWDKKFTWIASNHMMWFLGLDQQELGKLSWQ